MNFSSTFESYVNSLSFEVKLSEYGNFSEFSESPKNSTRNITSSDYSYECIDNDNSMDFFKSVELSVGIVRNLSENHLMSDHFTYSKSKMSVCVTPPPYVTDLSSESDDMEDFPVSSEKPMTLEEKIAAAIAKRRAQVAAPVPAPPVTLEPTREASQSNKDDLVEKDTSTPQITAAPRSTARSRQSNRFSNSLLSPIMALKSSSSEKNNVYNNSEGNVRSAVQDDDSNIDPIGISNTNTASVQLNEMVASGNHFTEVISPKTSVTENKPMANQQTVQGEKFFTAIASIKPLTIEEKIAAAVIKKKNEVQTIIAQKKIDDEMNIPISQLQQPSESFNLANMEGKNITELELHDRNGFVSDTNVDNFQNELFENDLKLIEGEVNSIEESAVINEPIVSELPLYLPPPSIKSVVYQEEHINLYPPPNLLSYPTNQTPPPITIHDHVPNHEDKNAPYLNLSNAENENPVSPSILLFQKESSQYGSSIKHPSTATDFSEVVVEHNIPDIAPQHVSIRSQNEVAAVPTFDHHSEAEVEALQRMLADRKRRREKEIKEKEEKEAHAYLRRQFEEEEEDQLIEHKNKENHDLVKNKPKSSQNIFSHPIQPLPSSVPSQNVFMAHPLSSENFNISPPSIPSSTTNLEERDIALRLQSMSPPSSLPHQRSFIHPFQPPKSSLDTFTSQEIHPEHEISSNHARDAYFSEQTQLGSTGVVDFAEDSSQPQTSKKTFFESNEQETNVKNDEMAYDEPFTSSSSTLNQKKIKISRPLKSHSLLNPHTIKNSASNSPNQQKQQPQINFHILDADAPPLAALAPARNKNLKLKIASPEKKQKLMDKQKSTSALNSSPPLMNEKISHPPHFRTPSPIRKTLRTAANTSLNDKKNQYSEPKKFTTLIISPTRQAQIESHKKNPSKYPLPVFDATVNTSKLMLGHSTVARKAAADLKSRLESGRDFDGKLSLAPGSMFSRKFKQYQALNILLKIKKQGSIIHLHPILRMKGLEPSTSNNDTNNNNNNNNMNEDQVCDASSSLSLNHLEIQPDVDSKKRGSRIKENEVSTSRNSKAIVINTIRKKQLSAKRNIKTSKNINDNSDENLITGENTKRVIQNENTARTTTKSQLPYWDNRKSFKPPQTETFELPLTYPPSNSFSMKNFHLNERKSSMNDGFAHVDQHDNGDFPEDYPPSSIYFEPDELNNIPQASDVPVSRLTQYSMGPAKFTPPPFHPSYSSRIATSAPFTSSNNDIRMKPSYIARLSSFSKAGPPRYSYTGTTHGHPKLSGQLRDSPSSHFQSTQRSVSQALRGRVSFAPVQRVKYLDPRATRASGVEGMIESVHEEIPEMVSEDYFYDSGGEEIAYNRYSGLPLSFAHDKPLKSVYSSRSVNPRMFSYSGEENSPFAFVEGSSSPKRFGRLTSNSQIKTTGMSSYSPKSIYNSNKSVTHGAYGHPSLSSAVLRPAHSTYLPENREYKKRSLISNHLVDDSNYPYNNGDYDLDTDYNSYENDKTSTHYMGDSHYEMEKNQWNEVNYQEIEDDHQNKNQHHLLYPSRSTMPNIQNQNNDNKYSNGKYIQKNKRNTVLTSFHNNSRNPWNSMQHLSRSHIFEAKNEEEMAIRRTHVKAGEAVGTRIGDDGPPVSYPLNYHPSSTDYLPSNHIYFDVKRDDFTNPVITTESMSSLDEGGQMRSMWAPVSTDTKSSRILSFPHHNANFCNIQTDFEVDHERKRDAINQHLRDSGEVYREGIRGLSDEALFELKRGLTPSIDDLILSSTDMNNVRNNPKVNLFQQPHPLL